MENSDGSTLLLSIGRLEGKLDGIVNNLNSQSKNVSDLNERISKLEIAKAWMVGAAAVSGGSVAGLLTLLQKGIH